jgi:hypothetical protein
VPGTYSGYELVKEARRNFRISGPSVSMEGVLKEEWKDGEVFPSVAATYTNNVTPFF